MKNLKIGKKLLVTFGIIITFLLAIVIISLFSLRTTGGNFRTFYQVGYPVSNKTTQMRASAQTGLKSLSQTMLTSDVQKTQEFADDAKAQFADVVAGFDFLKKNFQGDITVIEQT